MTMDFAPSPHATFSEALEAHIDLAMEARSRAESAAYIESIGGKQLPAIGAGALGEECIRAAAYQYHRTPKDAGRDQFPGHVLRIFNRGHDGEARMAEYIRTAGFTLLTENRDGKQFRFDVAKHEETGAGRIKGFIDGVVTGGPVEVGGREMKYPCLWENKVVNNKTFSNIKRHGLLSSDMKYYVQVQLNMAYMDLHQNPALFTVMNADNAKIYSEMIPFAPNIAQQASDKGVRIIESNVPEELPRIAKDRTFFKCKWCDYQDRCWAEAPAQAEADGIPAFLRR